MKKKLRSDIQGMRAVAVGSVIVAHIATYQAARHGHVLGGFIGVDVFFVLSGYLITSLLLREVDRTERVSLAGFYARRARRILPAATVVLVAVVGYAAWRLPDVQRSQFSSDAGWSVVFLANWHFASSGVNYFDTSVLSPLQHFWSLAVEEQFYIVWPLLIGLLAPRMRRTRLAIVVMLICVVSLGWSMFVTYYHGVNSAHEAYFSSPARAYELGIGALVAVVAPRIASVLGRTILGFAGLSAILASVVLIPADSPFPGWQALIPCLATAALLIAGDGGSTIVTRLLSIKPIRYVGDISYSLYLWHFPVIVYASTLFPTTWRLRQLVPVELVVMLALSTFSYYVIERPIHDGSIRMLRRTGRALVLWPLALVLVFGSISGGSAYAAHQRHVREQAAAKWYATFGGGQGVGIGMGADPSAAVTNDLRQALTLASQGAPYPPGLDLHQMDLPQPGPGYACYSQPDGTPLVAPCTFGDPSSSWVVALVGDSHAGMLIPFLDALGKQDHFRVVVFQMLGCAPYDVEQGSGAVPAMCDNYRKWAATGLKSVRPNVLVLYGRGFLRVNTKPGQTVADAWDAGITSALRRLAPLGAKVVLVGDIPSRSSMPPTCIESNRLERTCVDSSDTPEVRSNVVTEAVAQREHLGYVSMEPFACADGQCPLVVGPKILYWDDSHFTRSWIDFITPALMQKFGPLIDPPAGS